MEYNPTATHPNLEYSLKCYLNPEYYLIYTLNPEFC